MAILSVTSIVLFEMESGCEACQLIFHVPFPLVCLSFCRIKLAQQSVSVAFYMWSSLKKSTMKFSCGEIICLI